MKTFVSVGLFSLIVGVGGPVYAAKYNCEFQKNGTVAQSCIIDSAGTQACQFDFSANLRGICGVNASSNMDILLCAVTTPTASAANFTAGLPEGSAAGAARALAQKPGFVAGGLTLAPTGKAIVAGIYVEQQGAATLAGVCTP
jgi:hypothetical protein